MKKILFVMAAFWVVVFAESPKTEIVLNNLKVDNTELGANICDSIYAGIPEKERFEYRRLCWAEASGMEYNSPLDFSVVFYLSLESDYEGIFLTVRRDKQICNAGKTEGSSGTAQFSEVLLAELMRLQQYGVILNDQDSLKVLLNTEIKRMKEATSCTDIDGILYEQYDESNFDYWGQKSGCCSLVNSSSAVPAISWAPSNVRVAKMGKNRFLIQGAKMGSAYTLFDLNGKVLEQGALLSRMIQPPMLPAILKIQERTMLLK